jgi:cytochrome P450
VDFEAHYILPLSGTNNDKAYVLGSHNVAYMSSANFRDPEAFLPERWLPEGKDHFESDSKAVFEPFSTGQRSCLGRNLAWAEMRVIVARMLWNFDLELMPEGQNWIKRQRTFFLWEKVALPVKLTKAVRQVV